MMLRVTAALLGLSVLSNQAQALDTCNKARVEALGFITVGTASLASDNCAQPLLEPPLRLQFDYSREIPGAAMRKAATAMIKRNITDERFDALETRLKRFNASYRDIKAGDRYQLDYQQDGTVILRLNGEELARETGHDFADAYLQIWFGPRPYSRDMKQALLGRR